MRGGGCKWVMIHQPTANTEIVEGMGMGRSGRNQAWNSLFPKRLSSSKIGHWDVVFLFQDSYASKFDVDTQNDAILFEAGDTVYPRLIFFGIHWSIFGDS